MRKMKPIKIGISESIFVKVSIPVDFFYFILFFSYLFLLSSPFEDIALLPALHLRN
jgi:hypothetical protein